jgi:DNA polymerase (family X)
MAEPTNSEIAAALDELGDLSELDGAVIHRIVAYRNAAKAVRDASVSVTALAREGRATELPGVGAIIQEKILALADEGDIPASVKLRAKFPVGLLQLTRLPGLGPKRARRLFEELSIDSLDSLEAAASAQQIRALKGFGPKAEESILAAIAARRAEEADGNGGGRRVVLNRALAVGEQLLNALRAHPAAERVELAGSARRMTDSVKDLDIIATASDPLALAQAAAALELVETAQTPTASGVRLRTHTGLKADLRIVAPDQFGNLLQHFTGSKQHNMALREAAVRRGLHVSEYGVLDDSTGETRRCAREDEVYELLGLEYIEPELRENRGELEAAAKGTLPSLVTVADLRGDLHSHTTASDGTASIEEMALAARGAGYEYLAITDHSTSVAVRIDSAQLSDHVARIRELSGTDAVGGITLLAGSEVNILPDGSLDYDDETLTELDWVVASVHSSMTMDSAAMTARIVRAISNPLVDVIGHLSGRQIERRPPSHFDFPAIVEAARETGTLLEINSNPVRRVINSDAHRVGGFEVARYGVATARRAWLGPEAVVNTRPWHELAALRPRARG